MAVTIAAILEHKGHNVVCALPTETIADVVQRLTAQRVGAVLVLGAVGQLLGIVSERDIVASLAEHGSRTLEMTVTHLMARVRHTATPSTTVEQAMEMMTHSRFRYLPVLDGDRLLGIVSIGDIVKARLNEQEHEVDNLKAYVVGAAA
jgi:CBS domain-containing protein